MDALAWMSDVGNDLCRPPPPPPNTEEQYPRSYLDHSTEAACTGVQMAYFPSTELRKCAHGCEICLRKDTYYEYKFLGVNETCIKYLGFFTKRIIPEILDMYFKNNKQLNEPWIQPKQG